MKTNRIELFESDRLIARQLRNKLGVRSPGLIRLALKALCREKGLDYDSLRSVSEVNPSMMTEDITGNGKSQ